MEIDCDCDNLTVDANKIYYEIMLKNIIANAIKYGYDFIGDFFYFKNRLIGGNIFWINFLLIINQIKKLYLK